jgi:L-2,4-diaminobutyrate decarboxylase
MDMRTGLFVDASVPRREAVPVADGSESLEAGPFDPARFQEASISIIGQLTEYLEDASLRGLRLTDPRDLVRAARELMTPDSGEIADLDEARLGAIVDLYLRSGIQVYSPGYMGRQFSGVVPLSGTVDLVSAIVNQPSSYYEAGPLPSAVERIMAEELNRFIGWDPERFAMVTTSGGSLASLTALLAARNDRYPDFWSDGVTALRGRPAPAVAAGEDAHYCIGRAVGMLGIGQRQMVRLPSNRHGQICPEGAEAALDAAAERGLDVFCLVASAGTTSLGAYDPLDELADIAEARNLWLHVDGAHGASLLVSDRLRHRLKGIERVDSFAWDAHKLMFTPGVCTLLFYRDREKSHAAFVDPHHQASYVSEKEQNVYTAFDSAGKNFECTKRPLIMNLWVLWALYGRALFAEKIEYLCGLAEQAWQVLRGEDDFEAIHAPECNILCFRHRPADPRAREIPDLQVAIRDRVTEEGRFFISKVEVEGDAALRVVFMNHRIGIEHFRQLLQEIRGIARDLAA